MTPNLPVVVAVLPGIVVGLLLPLAIVGLVAYGVAELVRAGSHRAADGDRLEPGNPSARTSPAIAILDERFARGEVDTEDYVQRRDLLLASLGTAAEHGHEHGQEHGQEHATSTTPTASTEEASTVAAPASTDAPAASPTDEATAGAAPASDAPAPSAADDATGEGPSTAEQPPASG